MRGCGMSHAPAWWVVSLGLARPSTYAFDPRSYQRTGTAEAERSTSLPLEDPTTAPRPLLEVGEDSLTQLAA